MSKLEAELDAERTMSNASPGSFAAQLLNTLTGADVEVAKRDLGALVAERDRLAQDLTDCHTELGEAHETIERLEAEQAAKPSHTRRGLRGQINQARTEGGAVTSEDGHREGLLPMVRRLRKQAVEVERLEAALADAQPPAPRWTCRVAHCGWSGVAPPARHGRPICPRCADRGEYTILDPLESQPPAQPPTVELRDVKVSRISMVSPPILENGPFLVIREAEAAPQCPAYDASDPPSCVLDAPLQDCCTPRCPLSGHLDAALAGEGEGECEGEGEGDRCDRCGAPGERRMSGLSLCDACAELAPDGCGYPEFWAAGSCQLCSNFGSESCEPGGEGERWEHQREDRAEDEGAASESTFPRVVAAIGEPYPSPDDGAEPSESDLELLDSALGWSNNETPYTKGSSPALAWLEGRTAGATTKIPLSNPHTYGTEQALAWLSGWCDGRNTIQRTRKGGE